MRDYVFSTGRIYHTTDKPRRYARDAVYALTRSCVACHVEGSRRFWDAVVNLSRRAMTKVSPRRIGRFQATFCVFVAFFLLIEDVFLSDNLSHVNAGSFEKAVRQQKNEKERMCA